MKHPAHFPIFIGLLFVLLLPGLARAEHHHATHLGNPATRFAPPLHSPADVRARFSDPKLHNDFIAVLNQFGWPGDANDFFAAGLTNEIVEWQIPVGDEMPFMSSREAGRPICLRNVEWAGAEPAPAYSFVFHSRGRIYRCIIPKPCSNFFVTDLGPEPVAALALDCDVPVKVFLGRTIWVCLNLRNTGNVTIQHATISLPVPDGAPAATTTAGGQLLTNTLVWTVANLPAGDSYQVCARFNTARPEVVPFTATVASGQAPPASSHCETTVAGVPGILLEKTDHPDPVAVGDTTTYTVKVTNQGTAQDTHIQVVVAVAPELVPVSCADGKIDGQTVTLPVVPTLAPKAAVSYEIVAKGVSPGDGHTKFILSSDALSAPISAEESTTVY